MRFSVCIEAMFTDRPHVERLDAVRAAGLGAYEFWSWRDKDLAALRERQRALGLTAAALVLETGQPLVLPPDPTTIGEAARASIAAAAALECRTLIFAPSRRPTAATPRPACHATRSTTILSRASDSSRRWPRRPA